MRIVFDAQGAQGGSRFRGIGRYTRAFLRELARAAKDHEVLVLLNTMLPDSCDYVRQELAGLIPPGNFRTWSAETPIGGMHFENSQRRTFAQLIWEEAVAALEPDLVIVSSLFEGAEDNAVSSIASDRDYLVATICYDLIPMIYRQHYLLHPGMEAYYRRQIQALRRSDFLLAISQSAADEAVRLLRYPLERVINIGAAVDHEFGVAPSIDLAARFGITRPYLSYVSAFEVRKNHDGLIRAWATLPAEVRAAHQLVLGGGVGGVDHLRQVATEAGLAGDELVFTGSIDDGELAALYAGSKAVVFPSWHEGFGLPILEAMMFGKAVVASNCSSMPEVVGCEEALFDPRDPDSMAASIARVLTDDDFRARLEANAPTRVAAFSWARSARQALEFLEQGMARYPRPRDRHRRRVSEAVTRVRGNPELVSFPPEAAARHIARTFRRDERRQLLVDVSRLIVEDAGTGIQRVVRAILLQLLKAPPEGWVVEPVHANAAEPGYRYAASFADCFLGLKHHWHEDRPVEVWAGDVFCAVDLEPDVLVAQREVLDDWRERGVQVYTVVHDILPLLFPEYFPDSVGSEVIERWVRELARHSGAICVSATVAGQLEQWLTDHRVETNPLFRTGWFHHGSDLAGSVPTRGLPKEWDKVRSAITGRISALMVGTIEPRKGHAQAIAAFDLLWSREVDVALVIVGKPGWRIDELAERIRSHPEFGRRLLWLDGISDEALGELYRSCSFLLAASVGEGFGLPLVEAARAGLPLLVRDIPVFREVAGEGALFFANTPEPAVIADAIEQWRALKAADDHPKPSDVTCRDWAESARMLFAALTAG